MSMVNKMRIRKNGYIVTVRKARKPHSCKECHQPIERGDEYCAVTLGGAGLGSLKFPDRVCRSCIEQFVEAE